MDAERLLQAFSAEENRDIAGALPDELIRAEAKRRGLLSAVGDTAAQAAGAETTLTDSFGDRVKNYLNPEAELDASEQIEVAHEFWARLGHEVPSLTGEQATRLTERLEAHPGRRVVPTPLLDLEGRKAIAENAKNFPQAGFNESLDALWVPDDSWAFGKLLKDLEGTVKEGGKPYGLRYRAADGELVGRADFVAGLLAADQAVQAEDGTVWVFPVMDVRSEAPRNRDSVAHLHEAVAPTEVTEALIATQLLHQAAGTPKSSWHVDFANEAVYELDKRDKAVAPMYVSGVSWYPDRRQVSSSCWHAGDRTGGFGVRAAESGL